MLATLMALFLVAAAFPGTPVGVASAVAKERVVLSECTTNGSCTFECDVEGVYQALWVEVTVTSGSSSTSISAECAGQSTASCSGFGCKGEGESRGGSGDCTVTGTGKGTCRLLAYKPSLQDEAAEAFE